MGEKRFKKGINLSCVDSETGKSYWYACNLCDLLNEQQDIINKLKKELASVCVEQSLLCDELEILKRVVADE